MAVAHSGYGRIIVILIDINVYPLMHTNEVVYVEEKLLRVHEVAKKIGISVAMVWKITKAGEMPSPVKIGSHCTRWRCSEIDSYIASLPTINNEN